MEKLTQEKYSQLEAEIKAGRFVHFGGRSAGNLEQLQFIALAEGLTVTNAQKAVTTDDPQKPVDPEAEKRQKVALAKRNVTNAQKAVDNATNDEEKALANTKLEEVKAALAELEK